MQISLTQLTYHLVDAFTIEPFTGNPAAVVIVDMERNEIPTEKLQLIAREFNQPATAFVTYDTTHWQQRAGNDTEHVFGLRWFTPTGELPLCGHATLAASKLLFSYPETFRSLLLPSTKSLVYKTLSGVLQADLQDNGAIQLSFPSGELEPADSTSKDSIMSILEKAMGKDVPIVGLLQGKGHFSTWIVVELAEGTDLEHVAVRPEILVNLAPISGTIVTTKPPASSGLHFISRNFIPLLGIPEDHVSGTPHCLLGPYWAKKYGMNPGEPLRARQVSQRGGEVVVVPTVDSKGKGICFLRGNAIVMGQGRLNV